MAKYDFTNDNGILKVSLQLQSGLYKSQIMSLSTPSISLNSDRIKLFDAGGYKDTFTLSDIGLIAGNTLTTIETAYDALASLVALVLKTQNTPVVP